MPERALETFLTNTDFFRADIILCVVPVGTRTPCLTFELIAKTMLSQCKSQRSSVVTHAGKTINQIRDAFGGFESYKHKDDIRDLFVQMCKCVNEKKDLCMHSRDAASVMTRFIPYVHDNGNYETLRCKVIAQVRESELLSINVEPETRLIVCGEGHIDATLCEPMPTTMADLLAPGSVLTVLKTDKERKHFANTFKVNKDKSTELSLKIPSNVETLVQETIRRIVHENNKKGFGVLAESEDSRSPHHKLLAEILSPKDNILPATILINGAAHSGSTLLSWTIGQALFERHCAADPDRQNALLLSDSKREVGECMLAFESKPHYNLTSFYEVAKPALLVSTQDWLFKRLEDSSVSVLVLDLKGWLAPDELTAIANYCYSRAISLVVTNYLPRECFKSVITDGELPLGPRVLEVTHPYTIVDHLVVFKDTNDQPMQMTQEGFQAPRARQIHCKIRSSEVGIPSRKQTLEIKGQYLMK